VHALALAARDLAPGASAAQRAHGLAGLAAVPETSTERWMITTRATFPDDAQRAEPASARAVSLCAASAVAQNLRGNTLQMLQQIAPAEAAYGEAARLAPTYLAPRFNLGLLRLRSDDARAALTIFDQVQRAKPDYPNIHLVRADAYRRLGDRTQATTELEQQVQSQPDSGDGWLQLGRALQAHDRQRANAAFCRAKALGQSDAVALCRN
jgi:tetratricopeptide (TPR) repeat protein